MEPCKALQDAWRDWSPTSPELREAFFAGWNAREAAYMAELAKLRAELDRDNELRPGRGGYG